MEKPLSDPERLYEPSIAIQLTAKIGISCQFAALIRILAELLWLHHRGAADLSGPKVGIYLLGASIAAVFCWMFVMALWMRRAHLSIAVAAATILILLAIKVWAVRAGWF